MYRFLVYFEGKMLMPRRIITLSVVATAASLGLMRAASADPFLPVPPASFINYHVDTVSQLTHEVKVDSAVRARLARHFHMAQPAVAAYIANNLMLSYLQAPHNYRVACVTPRGREYYVAERLPAGTPVFALQSTGQPILKRACGNPLVSALPAVAASKVAKNVVAHPGQPVLAQAAATTDAPTDVVATTTLPGDTTLTAVPTLAGSGVGDLGPLTRVAGITQSLGSAAGSSFAVPGILAAIGTAAIFGSGHGGSSGSASPSSPGVSGGSTSPSGSGGSGGGTSPSGTGGSPSPSPVPAPEPSTAVIYGLGALGLTVLVLRRRGMVSARIQ